MSQVWDEDFGWVEWGTLGYVAGPVAEDVDEEGCALDRMMSYSMDRYTELCNQRVALYESLKAEGRLRRLRRLHPPLDIAAMRDAWMQEFMTPSRFVYPPSIFSREDVLRAVEQGRVRIPGWESDVIEKPPVPNFIEPLRRWREERLATKTSPFPMDPNDVMRVFDERPNTQTGVRGTTGRVIQDDVSDFVKALELGLTLGNPRDRSLYEQSFEQEYMGQPAPSDSAQRHYNISSSFSGYLSAASIVVTREMAERIGIEFPENETESSQEGGEDGDDDQ